MCIRDRVEALWGNLSLGHLVGAPRVVANHQALAAEQGRTDRLEMGEVAVVELEIRGDRQGGVLAREMRPAD